MTLRNKDGTVYKLAAPNPVMKSQNLWEGYTLHNMAWDPEKAEDNSVVNPISTGLSGRESFFESLDRAKQEMLEALPKPEIKVVEVNKPEIKVVETKPEKTPAPTKTLETDSSIEKTFIHALPARIRERKDSLYDDVYQTIQYDKPTSFEGVILSFEDLVFEVWTNSIQLGVGSIIYPKNNSKRWWRVQKTIAKSGGWIMFCIPSDEQPSFDL